MDGVLVINKPKGLSSHACVSQLRKILKTKKIGHSGTLDPEATGILVMGINKGTKILNFLNADVKAYQFTICFGIETRTLDHTGEITQVKPVEDLPNLDEVLSSFLGIYYQKAPAYSAVKVHGKKLYEYARKFEEIPEVAAKERHIYELKRLSSLTKKDDCLYGDFYVKCSKGLYVRQLALDLAKALDTVAHTTKIHRVIAGSFTIDEAIDLDKITLDTPLISMNNALKDYPEVIADDYTIKRIRNGQTITLNTESLCVKMVNNQGSLLAIYEHNDGIYKAKYVLM